MYYFSGCADFGPERSGMGYNEQSNTFGDYGAGDILCDQVEKEQIVGGTK